MARGAASRDASASEPWHIAPPRTRDASTGETLLAEQGGDMKHARLGRTGLKVSRLCLGTMNFGGHATEPESFMIMDRALEADINFFDTANVYGAKPGEWGKLPNDGLTEQIIGRWFAQGGGRRDR